MGSIYHVFNYFNNFFVNFKYFFKKLSIVKMFLKIGCQISYIGL